MSFIFLTGFDSNKLVEHFIFWGRVTNNNPNKACIFQIFCSNYCYFTWNKYWAICEKVKGNPKPSCKVLICRSVKSGEELRSYSFSKSWEHKRVIIKLRKSFGQLAIHFVPKSLLIYCVIFFNWIICFQDPTSLYVTNNTVLLKKIM